MHIRRHAIELARARPDALRQRGIVVATDQNPRPAKALQFLKQAAHGFVGHGLGIEHIARNQYRIDGVLRSQLCNAPYGGKTCLCEVVSGLGFPGGEGAANLPIGGMEKLGHRSMIKR